MTPMVELHWLGMGHDAGGSRVEVLEDVDPAVAALALGARHLTRRLRLAPALLLRQGG